MSEVREIVLAPSLAWFPVSTRVHFLADYLSAVVPDSLELLLQDSQVTRSVELKFGWADPVDRGTTWLEINAPHTVKDAVATLHITKGRPCS